VGLLLWMQSGNQYLLVMVDYLTKWPEVAAIPDSKANTVA
jgi:hypothetical protein